MGGKGANSRVAYRAVAYGVALLTGGLLLGFAYGLGRIHSCNSLRNSAVQPPPELFSPKGAVDGHLSDNPEATSSKTGPPRAEALPTPVAPLLSSSAEPVSVPDAPSSTVLESALAPPAPVSPNSERPLNVMTGGNGLILGRDASCDFVFGRDDGIHSAKDVVEARDYVCRVQCSAGDCIGAWKTCLEKVDCVGIHINRGATTATLKFRTALWDRASDPLAYDASVAPDCQQHSQLVKSATHMTTWDMSMANSLTTAEVIAASIKYADAYCVDMMFGNALSLFKESNSKLIFDVGMNDGTDSLYFLSRGYAVVAVEADPLLVEGVSKRPMMAKAALAKRFSVIQGAVGLQSGTNITFHRHLQSDLRSSIYKSTCNKASCASFTVPVVTCADLMLKYGTPELLKVDIEGADALCLQSLLNWKGTLPRYVTTEDPNELDRLVKLGYTAFKMTCAGRMSPISWLTSGKFSGGLPEEMESNGCRKGSPDQWISAAAIKQTEAFKPGNDLVARRG
jgi:FkbM family methyltransferase